MSTVKCSTMMLLCEGWCKHWATVGWNNSGADHWGRADQRWAILLHGWCWGAFQVLNGDGESLILLLQASVWHRERSTYAGDRLAIPLRSKSKYKHQCIAMVATIIIFKWWVRLLCSVWLKCKPNLNHIFEWWQCSAWHREVFREILQNTMEIFNDKYAVPGTGKYFVLATTPTRLYQFQGYVSSPSERPLLQQVF